MCRVHFFEIGCYLIYHVIFELYLPAPSSVCGVRAKRTISDDIEDKFAANFGAEYCRMFELEAFYCAM